MTDEQNKKLEKLHKALGDQIVSELESMESVGLKNTLVGATQAIDDARKECEENPQYQAAKQAVKDLSESLREVRKYQGAKIQYCLYLLESK